jgi:hypothetical protein
LIVETPVLTDAFRRRVLDQEEALADALTGEGPADGVGGRIRAGQLLVIRRVLVEANFRRLLVGGGAGEIRSAAVDEAQEAYGRAEDP